MVYLANDILLPDLKDFLPMVIYKEVTAVLVFNKYDGR